ncbi:DUF4189 domain-containing protein [Leeia sp. TBRC 13508]|uniref:DUF4189 domain-containing protein n=1 Tax=Leeia speluncae TaxID=2884804 RepID=A0ABS8D3M4_9NEIS|nr:DUF4189 domain-containing protein [Leeia speluncae]MCB6182806.1 DUF4189 domain-containing protein [Leeia speluncae]
MRLICLILFFISFSSSADYLCGEGYYHPELSSCVGPNGGYYPPGSSSRPSNRNVPRDYFGAIAVDVMTGQASYSANNYTSAAAAKSAAVQKCGLSGCKVVIAYKNGCGATAAARTPIGSPNHVVGGIGDSQEEAEEDALDKCEQLNPGVQCVVWAKNSCSYYE